MKRLILLLAVTALASPAFAQDEDDFDPSTVRIVDLIACKADVPTYNGVAFWMNSDEAPEHPLGMTKVESGNPFLSQYKLDAPIEVFGYTTQTVVFSNSGPMAVLETPDAAAVAKALEVEPAYATVTKFMGERIISETEESEGDFKWKTKVSLNVSNVDSHPGKTLAGCSYRIDME